MKGENIKFHCDKNFGLYLGTLTENKFHKHYATQISVSIKPNMIMRQKGGAEISGDFFYVPSKVEHQLFSSEIQLCILINPLSPVGHQFHLQYDQDHISIIETGFKKKLIDILIKFDINEIGFSELCERVTHFLDEYKCSCENENHLEDDRIIKALDFFDKNFDKVYSLDEIAEFYHLSPSRFLHLFKERTGLNFRRYQLWNKIIKSLHHLSTHSITNTAHTFGFTDSSHYTRTFKETFGVTPKFLLQNK